MAETRPEPSPFLQPDAPLEVCNGFEGAASFQPQ